ncbi:PREDICTED: uncharacterized protein LOC108558670 [Nicrophorus vespilloides]|uniref:Uncharacterized protein LOC108558670 n=1 Tax=Nicrophorus vespilloides TaxID=110193 RepID=A0ABM1M996_NICVS|nr:PREDICTED: uncharacterized protein LOC108558670 [Nicrophorus vespilloides]
MKGLLILSAVVVCTLARPDIGLKLREQAYQYQPPATSYGVPTGSYLPPNVINGVPSQSDNSYTGSVSGNAGSTANGGYSDNSGYVSGNTEYVSENSGNTGFTSGNSGFTSGNTGFTSGNEGYAPGTGGFTSGDGGYISGNAGFIGNTGGVTSGNGEYSSGNVYTSSGAVDNQNFGSVSSSLPGPAHVHKHVYFFDSPEDNEAPQLRVKVQPAAGHKNYKIIFIKAPSYKAPKITHIPAIQQNEEKTLVYVLVKKPEETQDIVIPSSIASKPSKPEVYFIKYKSQKEAEEKIQSIQNGGSSGISAQNVGSGTDFINTLKEQPVNIGVDTSVSSVSTVETNEPSFLTEDQGNVQTVQTSGHAQYGPPGVSGPY